MTEAEWLDCTDPQPMLAFLRGKTSDRKLRLFVCACCRRIWHFLVHPYSQNAVEAAERFADGLASDNELYQSEGEADDIRCLLGDVGTEAPEEDAEEEYSGLLEAAGITPDVAAPAAEAAWRCTKLEMKGTKIGVSAIEAVQNRLLPDGSPDLAGAEIERAAQTDLLREIIGNPFQSVAVDPSWLKPGIVGLVRTIYDRRDFDRLPILADLLEEAGCDNSDILTHCRVPSVRGCWVVDLILGKE